MTRKLPFLKHVCVIGCAAFVYNESLKPKVHATEQPGIFLSCDGNGVYTVELLASRKCVNSAHLTFDKTSFPALENSECSSLRKDDNWNGGDLETNSDSDYDPNDEQLNESMSIESSDSK